MDLRLINFGIEIETINSTREQVAHAIRWPVAQSTTSAPMRYPVRGR